MYSRPHQLEHPVQVSLISAEHGLQICVCIAEGENSEDREVYIAQDSLSIRCAIILGGSPCLNF